MPRPLALPLQGMPYSLVNRRLGVYPIFSALKFSRTRNNIAASFLLWVVRVVRMTSAHDNNMPRDERPASTYFPVPLYG